MSGVIDVSGKYPEKLTFLQRLYIPEILRGMSVTIRHLIRNLANMKGMPTILYPEVRRNYSGRFRGKHILKTREDGTLKCVACYMCQQACPAECITIVAGEHPKIAYEKYPVVFDIDMMRCVFCGFCVDACPKDAIRMDTYLHTPSEYTREGFVYDIPKLLKGPAVSHPSDPWYKRGNSEMPAHQHKEQHTRIGEGGHGALAKRPAPVEVVKFEKK